jgi:hypothetical protein
MFSFDHVYGKRALGLLAILGAMASGVSAQVGLGLAPMRVEATELAPGDSRTGVLTLTSDSTETVRVSAEFLDFFIDDTTNPQFNRHWPREADYSCKGWLALNPMETVILPGAQVHVRYTLRVPAGVEERSYHCAAGFTTQPTGPAAGGTALRTAVRVVAAFYAVVGHPRVQGLLKSLELIHVPGANQQIWHAAAVLENSGSMYYRPVGKLELIGADGQTERLDFTPMPVLPRRSQRFVFPLDRVVEGQRYTLRAQVDIGADEIQEGTAVVVARKAE